MLQILLIQIYNKNLLLVFRKIDLPKNYLSIRQKEIYSKSLKINHIKTKNLSKLLKDFFIVKFHTR